MANSDDKSRMAISEQAAEWFVADDARTLSADDAAQLSQWLRASPVHIEEFLGVAAAAQDLKEVRSSPEFALDAVLARARAADRAPVSLYPSAAASRAPLARHRFAWAALAAGVLLVCIGVPVWKSVIPTRAEAVAALRLSTHHGERLVHRLPDGSELRLNTDSSVSVRYAKNERLVELLAGEASFEVLHDEQRPFRVLAGPAAFEDVGTRFDVRLNGPAAHLIVLEGEVDVSPAPEAPPAAWPSRGLRLQADQQITIDGRTGSSPVTAIEGRQATAWQRGEIEFEREPLAQVVAEFNRYARRPIEITSPPLRELPISGSFALDDEQGFVAFLRHLKGARVEVDADRIRVSHD